MLEYLELEKYIEGSIKRAGMGNSEAAKTGI